jgi:hypothetical protein
MTDFKLTTPVAFIIFNRPDTTQRVFAEIAKAQPPKLLVVGDGPRAGRPGEAERVAATRAIIQRVDWDCEVVTDFSDVNLGCKKRVSSGIDWVFEQVQEAIILEDDCLPDPTFFRFCQEMLQRYRHDQRIGMISGDNFQFGRRYGSDSYYFSRYVHIWGWATWRDRWVGSYDVSMTQWTRIRDEGRLVDLVGDAGAASFWGEIFDRVHSGEIDTWDYQWNFANWLEGRLAVLPAVNLISNLGFGRDATHTTDVSDLANMPVTRMAFPLIHPAGIIRSIQADRFSESKCFREPLWKRVGGRLIGQLRAMTS